MSAAVLENINLIKNLNECLRCGVVEKYAIWIVVAE